MAAFSREMTKPAAELYDIDARGDPLLAEYECARDLLQGPDWRQGLKDLESLAHRGSIMSMLLVADALRDGWLYDQDLPRAERWYRVAVESASARGLFGLGLCHLLMNRFDEAIQNLEGAIAMDFPPAYNSLAGIYFRGDGVPIDRERALGLLRKGASLGHIPARRNIVLAFTRGKYGFWKRVEGFIGLIPLAYEIEDAKRTTPDSDRLR